MGTSSIVYVSIADTTSTCANLGLPTLPTGWTYNCSTAANLKKNDGTGWIPVNFTQITFGSPLSNLPVDPINTTSTGQYYTYVSGGSWIVTAIPESAKQKIALSNNPNISNYPGVMAIGSSMSISPLYSSAGLVGYWKFDEGSGTVAKDSSGMGNDGNWSGASVGTGGYYSAGKIGSWGGAFDGNNTEVTLPSMTFNTSAMGYTFSAWVYTAGSAPVNWKTLVGNYTNIGMLFNGRIVACWLNGASNQNSIIPLNAWSFVSCTYAGSGSASRSLYVNGNFAVGESNGSVGTYINNMYIGGGTFYFPGLIDDVRIYNRALSAAEVSALYNATK